MFLKTMLTAGLLAALPCLAELEYADIVRWRLARTEPDPEIQDLIRASTGLNLALDYLPGAVNFDPVAEQPEGELASRIVWFDAYVSNVDRTARNTNLLIWHRRLYLIDHGAALYFQHGWDGGSGRADAAFPMIRDHVLLPWADEVPRADAELAPRLTADIVAGIVAQVPDAWLEGPDAFADPAGQTTVPLSGIRVRSAEKV